MVIEMGPLLMMRNGGQQPRSQHAAEKWQSLPDSIHLVAGVLRVNVTDIFSIVFFREKRRP